MSTETTVKHTVATQSEVAEVFEVSIHTIEKWRADGMPGEKGLWPLLEIAEWRTGSKGSGKGSKANSSETTDHLGDDADVQFMDWETRFTRARALINEQNLSEKRGDLVGKDDVIRAFAARALQIKTGFYSLEVELPQRLYGLEIVDISAVIRREHHVMLEQFSAPGVPTIPEELMDVIRDWLMDPPPKPEPKEKPKPRAKKKKSKKKSKKKPKKKGARGG